MSEAPRAIADSLFRIDWHDEVTGYLECPGVGQHSHPTHDRDCRIKLDGAPTIFCFHTSCAATVDAANHVLRSKIGKASATDCRPYTPTKADRERERQRVAREQLKERAAASLNQILRVYHKSPAEFWEQSPIRPDRTENDWRLLLELFRPDDVVWIGDKFSSCNEDAPECDKERCRQFFRPAAEWLQGESIGGQFTCPSVFKPGTHSRSNSAVLERRYLVTESDSLDKEGMCAVINWCSQFMRLRAIVDTGGKSLHGWFDAPALDIETELRVILPNLGCDPALFKISQPCRVPGVRRDSQHWQWLLFLDLGGKI